MAVCVSANFNEKEGMKKKPKATKEGDRALGLSPTVSGLESATLADPDASSHTSDQGHSATDVCPGALFQARALLAHTHTHTR